MAEGREEEGGEEEGEEEGEEDEKALNLYNDKYDSPCSN